MSVRHALCQDNDLINTYLHHLNNKRHVLSHFENLNKAQSFGVPHGIYIQIFLVMLQIYIYLYLSIKDIYPNVFLFSIKLLTWYIFSTTLQQSFLKVATNPSPNRRIKQNKNYLPIIVTKFCYTPE